MAHALKHLPKISDSFRHGQISFSKVRAMTRVATPENEEYLMMIARHGTASHMEQLVRYFRKVERIEALEMENQRHDLRELNWHVDDDGSYVIKARLTPEQGERIVKAIESAMDEEFNERKTFPRRVFAACRLPDQRTGRAAPGRRTGARGRRVSWQSGRHEWRRALHHSRAHRSRYLARGRRRRRRPAGFRRTNLRGNVPTPGLRLRRRALAGG